MDAMTYVAYGLLIIVGGSIALAVLIIYLKSRAEDEKEKQSRIADATNDAPLSK